MQRLIGLGEPNDLMDDPQPSCSDSRWLLAYALVLSLIDDLHEAYKKGLWKENPMEILLHKNRKFKTKEKEPGGYWFSYALAMEFNGKHLDDLMNFIQFSTKGSIVVSRNYIIHRSKHPNGGRSHNRNRRVVDEILA